jgi:hypothetical protein
VTRVTLLMAVEQYAGLRSGAPGVARAAVLLTRLPPRHWQPLAARHLPWPLKQLSATRLLALHCTVLWLESRVIPSLDSKVGERDSASATRSIGGSGVDGADRDERRRGELLLSAAGAGAVG